MTLRGDRSEDLSPFGIGIAAVAVACCAGPPAVAAIFAGLSASALLGWAVGAVSVIGPIAGVLLIARASRRACSSTPGPERASK